MEEIVRERLGQLCLSDSGGSQKQERAYRATCITEAHLVAADDLGDSRHGSVLTHNAAREGILQSGQLAQVILTEPVHWDSRP